MRFFWLFAAVLAAAPCVAQPMDLPQYNVDALCAQGEKTTHASQTDCIYMNQQAYDELQAVWPDLSESVRRSAIGQCEKSPRPDYDHLLGCVSGWAEREQTDQEILKRAMIKHFRP